MSRLNRRIFIKQIGYGSAGLAFLGAFPVEASKLSGGSLPRSTPEKQGIRSTNIAKFLDAIANSRIEFHSIMIVRHGHVIAEGWWAPYAADLHHKMYSVSKSFTSSAVGFAVTEGKLTVEDSVSKFFPAEMPANASTNLAAMKIKHLLTMSTGHAKDTIPALRNSESAASWAQLFLNLPVDFEPGTHFVYNTGATYMLSAILQKVTGETLHDYLRPRLFDPLGITGEDWEKDPQGINTGGYGLRIKTEDLAKLGLLYLQKGKWNGKQLLPEQWVAEATTAKIPSTPANFTGGTLPDNDWTQGYGYQFWINKPMGFRADGAFGQFSLVLPEKDAVVAITGESFDLQASLNLVWENLVPSMKDIFVGNDLINSDQLKETLKGLKLERDQQSASSPLAATLSGKEFKLEANSANFKVCSLAFTKDLVKISFKDESKSQVLAAGFHKWYESREKSAVPPFAIRGRTDVPSKVAASATWIDEHTLVVTRRMIETPHSDQLTFFFDGAGLTIKFSNSISQGNKAVPEERPDLKGLLA